MAVQLDPVSCKQRLTVVRWASPAVAMPICRHGLGAPSRWGGGGAGGAEWESSGGAASAMQQSHVRSWCVGSTPGGSGAVGFVRKVEREANAVRTACMWLRHFT